MASNTSSQGAASLTTTPPTNAHETSKHPDVDETSVSEQKGRSWGVFQSDLIRKAPKKWIIVAFCGLYLMTFIFAFESHTITTYAAYATSNFKGHSLLSASRVVNAITMLLTYPIAAKLSDLFGRAQLFTFSIMLSTISLILFASCRNIESYFVAGFFQSIGSVGFGITQQIFISDVTTLRNRGIWLSLPDTIAGIPTLYLGTYVADAFLSGPGWRWGYGMWSVVEPAAAIPLLVTLFLQERKGKKARYDSDQVVTPRILTEVEAHDSFLTKIYKMLWVELDIPGAVLLIAGLALMLVPISLTGSGNSTAWGNASFIAMVVVGFVIFVAFLVWDAKFAKKPFIPFKLVRHPTIVAACTLSVLDFIHYSLFTVFLPSYLQVAGHFSPGRATRIDNSLRVAFQIASLAAALLMRWTRRAKVWVLAGVPLCVLGQGLEIYLVNIDGRRPAGEPAFIAAKALVGAGRGFYQTAAQVCVQGAVRRDEVAVATGVFFAAMNLGGAVGTSIAGAVWRANLLPRLEAYLPAATRRQAGAIFASIVVARKYAEGSEDRIAIDRAYRETQRLLAIGATGVLVPMLVAMWFVQNVDLGRNPRGLSSEDDESESTAGGVGEKKKVGDEAGEKMRM